MLTGNVVSTAGHEGHDVVLQLRHAELLQVGLESDARPLFALLREQTSSWTSSIHKGDENRE